MWWSGTPEKPVKEKTARVAKVMVLLLSQVPPAYQRGPDESEVKIYRSSCLYDHFSLDMPWDKD